MRHQVYGANTGRHAALIGVWDPILPSHEDLFREAADRAARKGQKLLVVTLSPSPLAQLRGATEHPTFDDVEARLFFQERCGVDTRITVSLSCRELNDCGAHFLLSHLHQIVSIEELTLGAAQSLGRGEAGSERAIGAFCAAHDIRLHSLPPPAGRLRINEAREHLRSGHLRQAVALLSRPLYWARPRSQLYLPWPPGLYSAIPIRAPAPLPQIPDAPPIVVELKPDRMLSRVRWPDRTILWLAFISGPCDDDGEPGRSHDVGK